VPLEPASAALHILAEITLILVLFTDAANIDLRKLRRDHNIPLRMLAIGMPLSILLYTFVLVVLFPIRGGRELQTQPSVDLAGGLAGAR
jgi:NhaP-type Na+/H+ or K+/H+ antiporter